MAYKLSPEIPIGINIKRIIRELDEKIINKILHSKKPKQEIIHYVRKRCKEVRGILRFLRPKHKNIYKKENTWYRDAARDIAFVRDLQSTIEATNRLFKHYKKELKKEPYWFIYEYLRTRRDAVYNDQQKLNDLLDPFLKKIESAHRRINFWPIKDKVFNTVKKGLLKTYIRTKKAMLIAYKKLTTKNFHEWRKKVKSHWFHLRLVSSVWPDIIKNNANKFEKLAEILGDEHDLAVLKETLSNVEWEENKISIVKTFFKYIDKRRAELRKIARPLGQKLLKKKPEYLSERLEYYWYEKQKELAS